MSTSATFAAISASQAAIAAQKAHEAKVLNCKMVEREGNIETIEHKKEYADCINTLYPTEISGSSVLLFKIIFVIAILSGCYGLYRDRNEIDSAFDTFMYFMMYFIMIPVVLIIILAIIAGIFWVLI